MQAEQGSLENTMTNIESNVQPQLHEKYATAIWTSRLWQGYIIYLSDRFRSKQLGASLFFDHDVKRQNDVAYLQSLVRNDVLHE
jgi:hypothetical protein